MPQLFSRSASLAVNVILACLVLAVPVGGVAFWGLYNSPWRTRQAFPLKQPVPFSHQHHVAGLGIDCRYCHDSVEQSAFAGIPPVHTCMTCHSQIWRDAPMLEPVRRSYLSGVPLQWVRVDNLPQFVFFNHSIHVHHGVGCSTCHGRVDRMPITWKANSFDMRWCLKCHRNPERYLRPPEAIYDMTWMPGPNQIALGRELMRRYGIETKHMTDCVTCHR